MRREEIEEIQVAEQEFNAVALFSHFDVGRTRGAEERGLLHFRNVFLEKLRLVETSCQIVPIQRKSVDPVVVPVLMVHLPQVAHIAHQGNDER